MSGFENFIETADGVGVDSDANLADNTIIRGDGGAKKVQDSGITIDDSDNISGVSDISATTFTGMGSGLTNISADDVDITDVGAHYDSGNVEGALQEIGSTNFLNGFDLQTPASLGDITISTRTVSIAVKSGESSFYFWANGMKIEKTTTQSVTFPDTTGSYFIYFDNSGTLTAVEESVMPISVIYENALVALVYWNATAGTSRLGSEQHGIRMSSSTHAYNHLTYGARYDANDGTMDIEGLSDGGTTYTQTTSGRFWDEDIRHTVSAESTHPYLYRLGAAGEWTSAAADNKLAIKADPGDTYNAWNEWTGSTWQLTEGGFATDYSILFFIATPSVEGNNINKLIGQNAYSSRNNARNAIEDEINNIVTDGLPTPEFIFLYAVIVKRDGTLEDLADGSLIYDLRKVKGGSGSSSGATSYAADVPTDTTSFDKNLSSTDVDVQTALNTLSKGAPSVSTEISSATPTIDTDEVDNHSITALATNITSMTTNLSGTPANFQKLIIRFLDNGTARTIAWGSDFEDAGAVLPTTTVISKLLTVGFIYNTVTSKWGCAAVANET